MLALVQRYILNLSLEAYPAVRHSNGLIIFNANSAKLTSIHVFSYGNNLLLGQVSRWYIGPISKEGDFIEQATKFYPLEENGQNSLKSLHGGFFNYNEISLT